MKTAINSRVLRTIPLLIAFCLVSFSANAQYSGGTGEPNDPYQIATAEDLMLLGESPEDYDKHFILTADIDLDPNLPGRKVFDKAAIAPDTNDAVGWFEGTAFSGVLDGNGHAISHLTITGDTYLGLFGQTGTGAKISNLGLEAVDVSGSSAVGGLVGHNSGSITTSYSTGTVSGDGSVGGLVGSNGGSITSSSYSIGSVSGGNAVGGLVGQNGGLFRTGVITACYSTGTVNGNSSVGGLVGSNVEDFFGLNSGIIIASYSTGSVSGDHDVGGLVGNNGNGFLGAPGGSIGITMSLWDMEASGQATSDGGTGATTAEMQKASTFLEAGWDFVDEVINGTCDYWLISPGEYPRLRYQDSESLQMPEGFGTAEQPYLIRDARDLGTVWLEPLAHYRLETSLDLSGIMWSMAVVPWFGGTFDGNGHVIRNLHIQGGGYLGLFGQTGSEARISNLALEAVDVNCTGCYYIDAAGGLVGDNSGSITNSYSTGSVSGDHDVGGLVGCNEGSITSSSSTGTVNGDGGVGGLVGSNLSIFGNASITSSYSTGSITGNNDVGGLVGDNRGSITSSYSTGTVNGNSSVGGLVGSNLSIYGNASITSSYSTGSVSGSSDVGGLVGNNYEGSITSSYSTGSVSGDENVGGLVGGSHGSYWGGGSIASSFWDIQTNGQTNMCGYQEEGSTGCDDSFGKTTAEMQTATTFTNTGWDFVDETENGTADIWSIDEGQDYPRLWWELIPEN